MGSRALKTNAVMKVKAMLLPALCSIALGIILIICFVLRQGKLENPLVNLQPLRTPAFSIGVLLNMIALVVMFAMNIIIPTFMQSVLGIESLTASLTLFPAILLSCIASPIAGRIFDKHGIRMLLPIGFFLVAAFSVATSLFIGTGNALLLAALYIPVICGCALIIGPVQSFALSHLSHEISPHSVTVMSTGFQTAGCLGSSVFTGIYAGVMAKSAASGADAFAAGTHAFLIAGCAAGALALTGFPFALKETRFETKKAPMVAANSPAKAVSTEAVLAETPVSKAFNIADIMKTDVYCIPSNATVSDALHLFVEKGISGAPIVDELGELRGIVTDGDIMDYISDQHTNFKGAYTFALEIENGRTDQRLEELLGQPVSRIATERVISLPLEASLGEAAQLLAQKHFKKVPVTQNGKMVGILNRSNLSKHILASYLEAQ